MTSVVILLGAPGAGKGTQAARLAAARGLPHVSTGDLFRANLARKTPVGLQAKSFMSAGKLVPDAVVLDMLRERVGEPDCARGYVLDGFPRTMPQARALEERLGAGVALTVVNLAVSDETIIERLSGRQREDDAPAVVRERLKVYHQETEPLVRFYAERGVLQTVDGERSPDEVFADLLRRIPA
jgi:adenylate kinase